MGLIYGSILPFVDLQFVGRNETATRSWNNVDLAQVHSDVTNFGRVANPCSLATVASRHAILPYKFTVKIDRTIDYTSYGDQLIMYVVRSIAVAASPRACPGSPHGVTPTWRK